MSYWYIQYENDEIRGYTILKINEPYFSFTTISNRMRKMLKMNDGYLQFSFIMPVSEASYLDFKNK